ncbi:MAG: SGNH/GDSL hydrolase family protein [Pseudomonadota bacterium]
MWIHSAFLAFTTLLAGPLAAQERIIVTGDSTMAWNDGELAAAMAAALGEPVRDESVSGARFSHPFSLLVGPMDIRAQLPRLPFDWLVVTGGANDFAAECNCGECGDVLDELVGPEGVLGEIPDYLEEVTLRGTSVIWALYYDPPDGGAPFDACLDEFAELDARLARVARRMAAVTLVDMGTLVSAADVDDYDPDRVHPSPQASERIGTYIARVIESLD